MGFWHVSTSQYSFMQKSIRLKKIDDFGQHHRISPFNINYGIILVFNSPELPVLLQLWGGIWINGSPMICFIFHQSNGAIMISEHFTTEQMFGKVILDIFTIRVVI